MVLSFQPRSIGAICRGLCSDHVGYSFACQRWGFVIDNPGLCLGSQYGSHYPYLLHRQEINSFAQLSLSVPSLYHLPIYQLRCPSQGDLFILDYLTFSFQGDPSSFRNLI